MAGGSKLIILISESVILEGKMWEKLFGVAIIGVAAVALALISIYDPPTIVQIICAFIGSVIFLMGVVIVFAEGSIIAERWGKKASKVK